MRHDRILVPRRLASCAAALLWSACGGNGGAADGIDDAGAAEAEAEADAGRDDAAETNGEDVDDVPAEADAIDEGGLEDAAHDAAGPYCDPSIGVVEPLPVCSPADPCTRVLAGGDTIVDPVYPCVCRTSNPERPAFDDGAPLAWTDPDGVERCACLFVPEGASASSPRPLLVFFHGSGGGAQNAYNLTSLRSKAVSYDTTGDPGRPGFVLLSIGGRNLHWPTATPEDGPKHDIYHRDLGSPSGNPDLANFDRLVDEIAARGVVDVRRIHVVGWSNGGRFAQLVAIARHEVATPGGNRVASAAIYSGADPFNNTGADRVPSCALDPYPTSAVPIFLVGRSCDLLPCDAAQAEDLAAEGLPVEPGDVMSVWVDDLRTKVEDPNVERIIVSGLGDVVGRCSGAGLCSVEAAYINHVRWPDGVADGSGLDHEPAMLDFLRDRPLP